MRNVQIDYDFARDVHTIKVTDDLGTTRRMELTNESLKDSAHAFARAAERLRVSVDAMASAFNALHGLHEFSRPDHEAQARARSQNDPVARELWRQYDAGRREFTLDDLEAVVRTYPEQQGHHSGEVR
jgi:hypothetical protein